METLLQARLKETVGLPAAFTASLESTLGRALDFAERVACEAAAEPQARRASSALYHAASAVLLAWEGTRDAADARRALLSRFVLEHRLATKDPLEPEEAGWEAPVIAALLEGDPVPLARVAAFLAA